jgi:Domain of unknown function (DUF4136)
MKHTRMALAFILVSLFACTAASAQKVQTDWDKKANFNQYHKYSWGKVQASNSIWQGRIQDAIDKDLQKHGWQRVDNGGEVVITAVGAVRNQQEYQTFYNGLGGWRWGGFGDTATTEAVNYRVGSLVVDLYDASTKKLLFRGVAGDMLSEKPESNEKKLEKAVDKMFEHFPPKQKS